MSNPKNKNVMQIIGASTVWLISVNTTGRRNEIHY